MNPESNPNQPSIPSDDPLDGLSPFELLRAAGEPAPPHGAAPDVTEIAAAFPKLEILGLLGQGGMGFVYKVRQPDLDRLVALKILRPELGLDPAFSERFAREARVLAKLNHPNIVSVFEHGQAGRFFYLLMEYVDGVNLRQAMRAGRFTPEQALAIVPGICDALQAAHAQGIWHRDIKPENILLDQDGRVKIVDFGIARIVGDPARDFTLTLTGAALGSAPYMAPEQHERPHDVDHRADIYSLGVVFYEMLTGELPLGRFPIPSERAAVHARIDAIVLQTLEKERELRQQSATEVKTDIQRAARDSGSARAEPAPTPSRAESWFSNLPSLVRRSLLAWLGGLLLLAMGVALEENRVSGAAFPLALGAVAAGLGLLGGLWSLFEMRRAWLPETGRGLLTWTMLLPVLVALACGGVAMGVNVSADGQIPYLLALPLVFICVLLPACSLRHFLHPGFQSARGWLIISCLLLCLAFTTGKVLQGQWPFLDAGLEEVLLRSPYVGDTALHNAEGMGNLRKAMGQVQPAYEITSRPGTNLLELKGITREGPESEGMKRWASIVARMNQLSLPPMQWTLVDYSVTPAYRTWVFSPIMVGLTSLAALAALLLSGCRSKPSFLTATALTAVAVAVALSPKRLARQPLASSEQLPLFTAEELPREVDFSTPEAASRTIVLAAHRGQTDIQQEAMTPAVAAELDKHNGWEIFFQPGKVVDPQSLSDTFFSPDPNRAIRRGGLQDGYLRVDGKWKLDTLAYAGHRFCGFFTQAAKPPKPEPTKQPEEPVVSPPKEDPIATIRLLNRLANEQNADAFLARKLKSGLPIGFGGDVPAASYMAPFYGEILQLGELPRKDDNVADVVAKFKRPDGKEEYRKLDLRLQDNEWRLLSDGQPQYRAWTLVAFKPPQGNASAILKNHLGKDPFYPVAGTDLFLIGGDGFDGDDAKVDASHRHRRLDESLKQAGLNQFLRVLVPAKAPSEPWMGGEPVVPEIPATVP